MMPPFFVCWWKGAGSRLSGIARQFAAALLVGCGLVFLPGCQSEPKVEPVIARFHLESKSGEAGLVAELPLSKVRIVVGEKPVFSEYDIVTADFTKTQLGWCFAFGFTPAAARDLYRMSVEAHGRRLILSLNNTALGVRVLDQPITDGVLLIFAEVPSEELPPLADRIRRTSSGLKGGQK